MARHGAQYLGEGRTRFSLWAPEIGVVELVLDDGRTAVLTPTDHGFHDAIVDAGPGTRYRYLLDGAGPFADPASRSQPDGVHGPSEIVAVSSGPPPTWHGLPLSAQVICELHVGTFSASGNFAGVVEGLDELAEAGYTAIELMPLGEFPGDRNWGYDGVFPYAIQSSYGGPAGLARLVEAAHARGIAVIIDVVYNHLGPEGGVHDHYGPYYTDSYKTPWGRAINLDGPGSDAVRAYFIEHACYLVEALGVDGLRLDALHAIVDPSASPFIAELTSAVHVLGRRLGRVVTIVGESSANDPRLVVAVEDGGLGCDGWWNDDFHHALAVTLTGERDRYFADYEGIADLATAFRRGYVLDGRESRFRGRRHGASRPEANGERFVVYAENHDQIANGGYGARLTTRLELSAQFPIAAAVLLAPFVPLRFMGEEYGELAPFHFFTSYGDDELIAAMRRGRAAELGAEGADPQDEATFRASRPDRTLRHDGVHGELLAWQRLLLDLRADEAALSSLEPLRSAIAVAPGAPAIAVLRCADPYLDAAPVALALNLGPNDAVIDPGADFGDGVTVLAQANTKLAVGDAIHWPLTLPGYAVIIGRPVTSR